MNAPRLPQKMELSDPAKAPVRPQFPRKKVGALERKPHKGPAVCLEISALGEEGGLRDLWALGGVCACL